MLISHAHHYVNKSFSEGQLSYRYNNSNQNNAVNRHKKILLCHEFAINDGHINSYRFTIYRNLFVESLRRSLFVGYWRNFIQTKYPPSHLSCYGGRRWSRRVSNPRPEKAIVVSSTCLVNITLSEYLWPFTAQHIRICLSLVCDAQTYANQICRFDIPNPVGRISNRWNVARNCS